MFRPHQPQREYSLPTPSLILSLSILILLLPGTYCLGQAGKTELFGTITDSSNLPVPNAKVQAEEQNTAVSFASVSDGRGEYHFLGLPAGQYILTVETTRIPHLPAVWYHPANCGTTPSWTSG